MNKFLLFQHNLNLLQPLKPTIMCLLLVSVGLVWHTNYNSSFYMWTLGASNLAASRKLMPTPLPRKTHAIKKPFEAGELGIILDMTFLWSSCCASKCGSWLLKRVAVNLVIVMRFKACELALVGYSPPFSNNTLQIQPLFILTPRSDPDALALSCGLFMFSEQRRNAATCLPTTNFEVPLLSPPRLHLVLVNRQSNHFGDSNPLTLPNLNLAGFRPVQPS